MTVGEILQTVEKDRAFYADGGGITVSGGEPFLQAEGTLALLQESRARGLSTAVETCGYAEAETLLAAVADTDLFLWDVKDTNDERHTRYTGVSNRRIFGNLRAVDRAGGKTRLRCILVNGVNTDAEHYHAVAELASSLLHCEGVEWLPYHAYGGTKSVFLGLPEGGRAEWIPTEAQIREAKETVSNAGVRIF
jgi:pyruvate formate lyase activating enzyme